MTVLKSCLPAYHTQSGEAWGQNEVPGSRKLTVHTREPMGIKVIRSRWFSSRHLTGLHPGHRALGYWAAEDGGASQSDNGRQLTGSQCDRSEGNHQQHREWRDGEPPRKQDLEEHLWSGGKGWSWWAPVEPCNETWGLQLKKEMLSVSWCAFPRFRAPGHCRGSSRWMHSTAGKGSPLQE